MQEFEHDKEQDDKYDAGWRRDRTGQERDKSGCFSSAMRKGAVWNPKLDREGKDAASELVTLMHNDIDGIALAVNALMQLNVAMVFKGRVGRDYFKDATHWCHAILCRELWIVDLGPVGAEALEVKVRVG